MPVDVRATARARLATGCLLGRDGRHGGGLQSPHPGKPASRRCVHTVALWLAYALLIALAAILLGSAPRTVRAQAEPEPCSVSGSVALPSKLVCPYDPVEARVRVRLACPRGAVAPRVVRAIHVSYALPPGVFPHVANAIGGAPSHSRQQQWHLDLTTDEGAVAAREGVTLTHRIQTVAPGEYLLGAEGHVRLVDGAGHAIEGPLTPGKLVVSAACPRPSGGVVFLPSVSRSRCTASRTPADIALLMDRSTSMGSNGLVAAAERAGAFLDAVDLRRDRVAVLAFDQDVTVLAPLGSSRAVLEVALGGLRLAPGTRLERALAAGIGELTGPHAMPGRRRLLVLVTDGVQTGPGGAAEVLGAAEIARSEGVTVLTLALGAAPDAALLKTISGKPDHSVAAPEADDLDRAYRDLATVASCAR